MAGSAYKDVSSLLSSFLDSSRFVQGRKFSGLHESWSTIAGERLAAHTRPTEMERGILVVEAEHPGWIQLLQMRQSELLQALNRNYPELEIRSIAFRVMRQRQAGMVGAAPGTAGRGDRPKPDARVPRQAEAGEGHCAAAATATAADAEPVAPKVQADEAGARGTAPCPEVVALFAGLKRLMDERDSS
jgi:hypothetical protein